MRLVLFGSRLSPFVEKVARGLARKELDFELLEPRAPWEFRRWNPRTGKMPVLEIDGERLHDSTLILRELDRRAPKPALVSPDPEVACRQRLLEDWADESLYWCTMALRWSDAHAAATIREMLATVPAPVRLAIGAVLRRRVQAWTQGQGMGRLPEELLLAEVGGRLDDLERTLGERPFFYADEPSVADLAVYGQLCFARLRAVPALTAAVERRAGLVAFSKRLEAATGG
jgi:glutathione S-transferase